MSAEKPGERAEAPGDDGPSAAQLVDRIEEELELLHLPIHKTRYSLHLLEREGVIQPSADGAVVTDQAKAFWSQLHRALGRMQATIQHLQERAAEHEPRPPAGRKGY